jgi:hypothetical protein
MCWWENTFPMFLCITKYLTYLESNPIIKY